VRVNVVELRSGALPHGGEYEEPAPPWNSVLYAAVPRWTQPGAIDSLLYELDSAIRAAADLIVLRAHQPDAASWVADPDLARELEHRHNHRPIYVLCWQDDRYQFVHLAGAEADLETTASILLKVLRDAELAALVAQPGVELPESGELHYIGPNGYHYGSFIRVGTAIQSIDRLDAVSFWLLEYLGAGTLVLLDSWTIMSLGLNLLRYPRESSMAAVNVLGVECRRSYDEGAGLLQARVDALVEHLVVVGTPPSHMLIVTSTISTGDSVREMRRACEHLKLDTAVIGLYAPDEEHADAVFRRRHELGGRWKTKEECPLCQERVAHVPISPSTYHLEVTALVEPAQITNDLANTLQPFFDAYRGCSAFCVHAWQRDDRTRHHMVDVDVRAMMGVQAFTVKLEQILAGGTDFEVILTPGHAAAAELAREVSQLTGHDVIESLPEALDQISNEGRAKLRGKRVLLVDDVVVSGTRLHVYRQALQTARLTTGDSELKFLVGLARPSTNELLRTIRNTVHGAQNFFAVETLLLPHWGDKECPWCWELDRLRELGPDLERHEYLHRRFKALEQPEGLGDELFLRWDPADDDFWRLGPQSLFHADSEPELFAAVAAALQELRGRDTRGLNESLATPLARVMAHEFFLSGTYYAPVIKACVLRAARQHDIRAHRRDPEVVQLLEERLREEMWHGLVPELVFAMGHHQLPPEASLYQPDGLLSSGECDAGVAILLPRLLARAR
jgi:orotate phosphoribosyltransferase